MCPPFEVCLCDLINNNDTTTCSIIIIIICLILCTIIILRLLVPLLRLGLVLQPALRLLLASVLATEVKQFILFVLRHVEQDLLGRCGLGGLCEQCGRGWRHLVVFPVLRVLWHLRGNATGIKVH